MADKKTSTAKDLAQSLGLSSSNAVEWEFRYSLTNKIVEIIEKKNLTVTEVAKKAGTSRARITKLLKGDSLGISIDVLVRVLGSLGQSIKVSFQKVA